MNAVNYKYSILKYRHSALLGESLNIGVLIYFEENHSFEFLHPKNLNRIKSIYSNVSDKLIKYYFSQIEDRLRRFEGLSDNFLKIELHSDFDSFIAENILPLDASSLQFSKVREGFYPKKDFTPLLEFLKTTYLLEDLAKNRSKDYTLIREFYGLIKEEIHGINTDLIIKDYKVQNNSGVEFTFNYAWQNGSLNLVKPLNFDLQDARFISEKAHKNYGLVIDLNNKAIEDNLKFDYLVGKPKKESLFREYEHSLNLLGALDRVTLIEEDNIREYSKKAIDAIRL